MITSSVTACIRGRSANGSPAGQRLDLLRGHLGHQLLVALHALAVERRQHQPALCHVLGVVEQQHGVRAEHGPQHDVRLAGVKHAPGPR